METYLIAGLGNPDKKYENTRHNAGFNAIDHLAEKLNIRVEEKKYKGLSGSVARDGKKLILLKPQTYMNLSGEAVMALMARYGFKPEEIVVVYDDIDLPPGALRFRPSGSAGTHNGMRNIIAVTGRTDIPRLRIGVGVDRSVPLADYVLSDIKADEEKLLPAIEKAADFLLEKLNG